jgi:hypothetical protein
MGNCTLFNAVLLWAVSILFGGSGSDALNAFIVMVLVWSAFLRVGAFYTIISELNSFSSFSKHSKPQCRGVSEFPDKTQIGERYTFSDRWSRILGFLLLLLFLRRFFLLRLLLGFFLLFLGLLLLLGLWFLLLSWWRFGVDLRDAEGVVDIRNE